MEHYVLSDKEMEDWEDPDGDYEPNELHYHENEVKENITRFAQHFDPEIFDEISKQLDS